MTIKWYLYMVIIILVESVHPTQEIRSNYLLITKLEPYKVKTSYKFLDGMEVLHKIEYKILLIILRSFIHLFRVLK